MKSCLQFLALIVVLVVVISCMQQVLPPIAESATGWLQSAWAWVGSFAPISPYPNFNGVAALFLFSVAAAITLNVVRYLPGVIAWGVARVLRIRSDMRPREMADAFWRIVMTVLFGILMAAVVLGSFYLVWHDLIWPALVSIWHWLTYLPTGNPR